jgi:putative endonuclease
MREWQVYILSCCDGTLYTGIAVDVARRLEAHQDGVGAKYTRSRLPVALVYQEQQPDRSGALKREAAIRRMGRAGKLALIASSRSTGAPKDLRPRASVLDSKRIARTTRRRPVS